MTSRLGTARKMSAKAIARIRTGKKTGPGRLRRTAISRPRTRTRASTIRNRAMFVKNAPMMTGR